MNGSSHPEDEKRYTGDFFKTPDSRLIAEYGGAVSGSGNR